MFYRENGQFKTSYKAVITAAQGGPDDAASLPPISIDLYGRGQHASIAAGAEVFLAFSPDCSIVAAAPGSP